MVQLDTEPTSGADNFEGKKTKGGHDEFLLAVLLSGHTAQRQVQLRWRGQPMNESQPKRWPIQDSRQRQLDGLLGLFAFPSNNFRHLCPSDYQ